MLLVFFLIGTCLVMWTREYNIVGIYRPPSVFDRSVAKSRLIAKYRRTILNFGPFFSWTSSQSGFIDLKKMTRFLFHQTSYNLCFEVPNPVTSTPVFLKTAPIAHRWLTIRNICHCLLISRFKEAQSLVPCHISYSIHDLIRSKAIAPLNPEIWCLGWVLGTQPSLLFRTPELPVFIHKVNTKA